jgi:hypothetical protein
MQRMISRSTRALSMLAFIALAAPLGCGGGGASAPDGVAGGEAVDCNGTPRQTVSCQAPEGGSLKVSGAETKAEETAMERINASIDELTAERMKLCSSYNSCAIDEASYKAGAEPLRQRFEGLKKAIDEMKTASSYGVRKRALDVAYRGVVPAAKRVEELTFRMGLQAELPANLGGGQVDIEPGSVLPTNARVVFAFEVTKDAHLYIFQRTPKDELTVLFPDKRIGTQNPLKAGNWIEIPPDGRRFRVNDKDIGDENVYIVVSQKPISSLDGALQKVKDGAVTKIGDDNVLKAFTTVVPGKAKAECARGLEFDAAEAEEPIPACRRSRGLVLDEPEAEKISFGGEGKTHSLGLMTDHKTSGRSAPVMEVVTDPGDSVIVKVFPFKHVTEAEYPAAIQAQKAAEKKGVKTRGLVAEY